MNARCDSMDVERKRLKLGAAECWFRRRRGGDREKTRKDFGWRREVREPEPGMDDGEDWSQPHSRHATNPNHTTRSRTPGPPVGTPTTLPPSTGQQERQIVDPHGPIHGWVCPPESHAESRGGLLQECQCKEDHGYQEGGQAGSFADKGMIPGRPGESETDCIKQRGEALQNCHFARARRARAK